ncbi:MAG TPA: HdeD family acid-resistance protein [Solirubrobacteraceae bacterium]|nr:HdeD family acid-resistance protein [Solirubrobacteraceae bacterium]
MPEDLKAFRSLWWLFLIFGLITLAAGIIVLVWPSISLQAISVIIGIFLLIDGIFELIASIGGRGQEGRGLVAVLGVISVIAGIFLIRKPFNAVTAFVIVIGIWFVIAGLAHLVAAVSDRDRRGTNITIGLLEVAAGVVVLVWPHVGLATLAIIIGVVLIIRGVAFIVAAWQIRKLPKLPDDGGAGGAAFA